MNDYEQGYQDHALALGRDPKKMSSVSYQAGWKQSKIDTRNITNHGKALQQANAQE